MIVWDLGDVVAAFRPQQRLAALAAATGLDPQRIEDAIWGSGLDAAAERGELDEPAVWSATLAALDDRVEASELRRCWSAAFEPLQEVLDVIDRTARPRALFTDNGPILAACLRHELAPVTRRFDTVVLSCQIGAVKSEAVAHRRAAALLDHPCGALTLIDDREVNVAAARSAGWQAIHFTGIDDLGRRGSTTPANTTCADH